MSNNQEYEAEYEQLPQGFEMKENQSYESLKITPQMKKATDAHKQREDTQKVASCEGKQRRIMVAMMVIIILMNVMLVAVCIAVVIKVSNLKTNFASTQQENQFNSADLVTRLETTNESLEKLTSVDVELTQKLDSTLNSLLSFEVTANLVARLDILNASVSTLFTNGLANRKQQQQFGNTLCDRIPTPVVASCAALPPSSPSGYYWIWASNGSTVHVYCDMTRSCGNMTGGWMRVAHLDTTNTSHQCPSGFTLLRTIPEHQSEQPRTCVSLNGLPNCSADTFFETFNISYSRVCGKVIGYQIGNPNGFIRTEASIDSIYVDGVSLTYGSPRKHIWTFAVARDMFHGCPGDGGPPSYVGTDYFCDTGAITRESATDNVFFADNPLWDCEEESVDCDSSSPPWFYRQLPQPTTDNIEMRVCRNEAARHEDVAIKIIEIYIQ